MKTKSTQAQSPTLESRFSSLRKHQHSHLHKRFSLQGKLAITGLALLALLLLLTPIFSPYAPDSMDLSQRFAPPSSTHWLGCDHLGRDMLTRLVYGAYISLEASACIIILAMAAGISIGWASSMLGGVWDRLIMRVCDVFLSLPTLVLALFFISVLGSGLANVIIAIALTHWAFYARIARSLTQSLRAQEYIAASYMQGVSFWGNFWSNFAPTITLHILVLATMDIGHIMLHIAGLSFIGLGVQPPLAEWGVMLGDMREYLYSAPELLLYPGVALFVCVALFSLLGDSLQRYFSLHLEDMYHGA
ncbi:ABC transporter permease subunit [uncultured Helicobacter sp.]|uniref:ABC transporter permease subunit n=1 Tax=uncultured Helicobacter sp. TaxID=175537 RepID=UPI002607D11F|nr:ABC transporter permease subunit [uncultured Helicobacter sp.]